ITTEGWEVRTGSATIPLRGRRGPELRLNLPPSLAIRETPDALPEGTAPHVLAPPALDGTLAGFDCSAPIELDHDDQYRRSEEPYVGPTSFGATAWLNWDEDSLYLAVEVVKPDLCFRAADAPPLNLDNEPDELNADGLQVYVADDDLAAVHGYL